ncbi:MAG TPA: glycerol kinase GlpK, partial [Treponemataceae bacterium]|nr:glycerol kinase GlpK [Treponemataceae bacterium]
LAENGEILFGTVDTWLLWKLTGQHVTDITNASRTLLFNIREEKWDPVLLSVLGIPEQILPTVKSSSDNFGSTKTDIFGVSIPVTGVAGDQQAALFGHTCFSPGMAKNTYGTGCFTLLNTGDKPVWSKNNLLTTIAWKINNHTTFALEGSVFVAGAIIQWLRDELKIITSSAESEELARSVPSSEGVYIVPAFTGLGAPYWDSDTRASILGLSRGSNKAHIARAALESICYQSEDLLASMQADCNEPIAVLKADGGATANSLLMQLQADISNIPVLLPGITEITALGAAYLSGLYTGFWENLSDIEKNWQMKCRFVPSIRDKERKQKLDRWHKAVSVTREF